MKNLKNKLKSLKILGIATLFMILTNCGNTQAYNAMHNQKELKKAGHHDCAAYTGKPYYIFKLDPNIWECPKDSKNYFKVIKESKYDEKVTIITCEDPSNC